MEEPARDSSETTLLIWIPTQCKGQTQTASGCHLLNEQFQSCSMSPYTPAGKTQRYVQVWNYYLLQIWILDHDLPGNTFCQLHLLCNNGVRKWKEGRERFIHCGVLCTWKMAACPGAVLAIIFNLIEWLGIHCPIHSKSISSKGRLAASPWNTQMLLIFWLL